MYENRIKFLSIIYLRTNNFGLLYGRRFFLRLIGTVYKSYMRPAILYRSDAWCLKESEMGIL